ncbi:MAG: trehalose-phosphatase [bacterium]|nr:trehalose-phosphatase [bacterium]
MIKKHFFDPKAGGWNTAVKNIRANRPLLLLLDYDGTITPIKSSPGLAILPSNKRDLIEALSEHPGVRVGFVTGRSLTDIWKLVRLENVIYIANHGLQIRAGKLSWIHPRAKRTAHLLSAVGQNLKEVLGQANGVEIEDKVLTVSIHYRNMRNWPVARLKESIKKLLQPHQRELKLSVGKKVIEIRPNIHWDKGLGVQKIVKMLKYTKPPLKIFLGDDVTDEDVFRVLKKDGIGIRVGRSLKTEARYYLRNPKEVFEFLKLMGKSLSN